MIKAGYAASTAVGPDRAALTPATVAEQRPPDLVRVVFDSIDQYERGRIRTFIDGLK